MVCRLVGRGGRRAAGGGCGPAIGYASDSVHRAPADPACTARFGWRSSTCRRTARRRPCGCGPRRPVTPTPAPGSGSGRPVDVSDHRRLHTAPARPPSGQGSATPMGAGARTWTAHPGSSPRGVSEPPPVHALSQDTHRFARVEKLKNKLSACSEAAVPAKRRAHKPTSTRGAHAFRASQTHVVYCANLQLRSVCPREGIHG